jgi:hypothetical protein
MNQQRPALRIREDLSKRLEIIRAGLPPGFTIERADEAGSALIIGPSFRLVYHPLEDKIEYQGQLMTMRPETIVNLMQARRKGGLCMASDGSQSNVMKFFVTGEGGTSALLATLLDPSNTHEGARPFREWFAQLLGLSLPESGPEIVKTEVESLDLLLIWGEWVIVVENKVAAASIVRGQLQKYYQYVIKAIAEGRIPSSPGLEEKHVCMVYLTPAGVGREEFDSLHLDETRQDRKAHLSWDPLLEAVDKFFPRDNSDDSYTALVSNALALTKEILVKNRPPVTPDTPQRVATKKFLDEMEKTVGQMLKFEDTCRFHRWKDPKNDSLYGHIGGEGGNVYFSIFPEGTDLSECDNATIHFELLFKTAGKSSRSVREEFRQVPLDGWGLVLGLENRTLVLGSDNDRISLETTWKGTYADLLASGASMFCRSLLIFRPFMIKK